MIVQKQATLDRFEGKQAIIALENGQEVSILKEELGALEAGSKLLVRIMPEPEASLEKDVLARTLLNQILNDQEGSRKD